MFVLKPSLAIALLSVSASAAESFDYVIVGGGTAGLVLANRLSESPQVSVAVIEPGDDQRGNPNVTNVNNFELALNTPVDWQYPMVPQTSAQRDFLFHSGKAIGGTSTINGMTYIRGQKAQLDAWERIGNTGWNWDVLFPYYKKAEHYEPPTAPQIPAGASYEPQYHGFTGPVHISYPYSLVNGSYWPTVEHTWEALGQPHNLDVNSGNVTGVSTWPFECVREQSLRADAAQSYYYPVMGRPNLKLFKGNATRVVLDKNACATGVEYLDAQGTSCTLAASKEVILSAGSLRSPALLELSGIGNPRILAQHGIRTQVALSGVGENLQDQPNTAFIYTNNLNFSGQAPYATYATAEQLFGANTSTVAAASNASISRWAAQVSQANGGAVTAQTLEYLFGIQHDLIFQQSVPNVEILTASFDKFLVSAFWTLLPFSRGSVHIASADPTQPPRMDPKYFLVDFDMQTEVGIARLVEEFWETKPASTVAGALVSPMVPTNATDAQMAAVILASFGPNYHPLGTAAMLPRSLGGVVDPSLRVYGTKNLRVVDASILPMQLSGHLTATIYAVAERAADLIKAGQ